VRTFKADIAERAENWTVHTDRDGVVQRVSHVLPESRPGATLDVATAKEVARRTLVERFHIDAVSLKDVSAGRVETAGTDRLDIIFSDASRSLPQGELRLSRRIAGRRVADGIALFTSRRLGAHERNRADGRGRSSGWAADC